MSQNIEPQGKSKDSTLNPNIFSSQDSRPNPNANKPQFSRPNPNANKPQFSRPNPNASKPQYSKPNPNANKPQFSRPNPNANKPQYSRPNPNVNKPQDSTPDPNANNPQDSTQEPNVTLPLVLSIVSMVLAAPTTVCCILGGVTFPAGIASIVYATKYKSKLAAGIIETNYASQAKIWAWVAVGFCSAGIILSGIINLILILRQLSQ